jgi:hypothetical protein
MGTDLSEIESLCDSRITSTDDCDREILIEVAITGRTVGDSLPIVLYLSWDTEFLVSIARC